MSLVNGAGSESGSEDAEPDVILRNDDIEYSYHINDLNRQLDSERTKCGNPVDLLEDMQRRLNQFTEHLSSTTSNMSERWSRQYEKICSGFDIVTAAYLDSIKRHYSRIDSIAQNWILIAEKHGRVLPQQLESEVDPPMLFGDADGAPPASKRQKVADATKNSVEAPSVISLHSYQQQQLKTPSALPAPSSFEGWGQSADSGRSHTKSAGGGWGSSAGFWASSTPFNSTSSSSQVVACGEILLVSFTEAAAAPDPNYVREFFARFGPIKNISMMSSYQYSVAFYNKADAQSALSRDTQTPLMWDGGGRLAQIAPQAAPQPHAQQRLRIQPGDAMWIEIMEWVNEGVTGHGVAASAKKFNCGEGLIKRILSQKKNQQSRKN